MNATSYLIRATINVPKWPSGKGKEIGAVFGGLKSIATDLARPFLYDDEIVTTFILSEEIGLILIGLELSHIKKPAHFLDESSSEHSEPTFFSIYVDELVSVEVAQGVVLQNFSKAALIDFYNGD